MPVVVRAAQCERGVLVVERREEAPRETRERREVQRTQHAVRRHVEHALLHVVGAGPQLDDPVCAGAVGDDGARLFDEGRAGGLDGDARQEGPRCVPYDAGNATGGRLCQERNRQEETADREGHRSQKSHGYAP